MSSQVEDPFELDGQTYTFIEAENVYALFGPERYGLKPGMVHTGCVKGFVCYFAVRDERLFLDRLEIYTEDHRYPRIHGVRAKRRSLLWGRRDCREYRSLRLFLDYTGIITVGSGWLPEYDGYAFMGREAYEWTMDLSFQRGVLIERSKPVCRD